MPTVNKSVDAPYSAAQMYQLVDAVEQYPEFIPACHQAEILSRTESEVQAKLSFAAAGIEKSFSTRNLLKPNESIEIHLLNGPFRHLHGFWRFEALKDGCCRISLALDFEFSNKMVAMMFGPVFHQVVEKLVDAFTERAEQVYGNNS